MAFIQNDIGRLIKALEHANDVAAIIGDDLDDLVDKRLNHRCHLRSRLAHAPRGRARGHAQDGG